MTYNQYNKNKQELERDSYDIINNKPAKRIIDFGSLIPTNYDYITLTYVSSGNGSGKIETATYKTGGYNGTIQAILTLTYNADNKISSITRT